MKSKTFLSKLSKYEPINLILKYRVPGMHYNVLHVQQKYVYYFS